MEDKETGSEWSHILGQAMSGPLKDTSLELIPSVITDWESWSAAHPATTVTIMSRSSPAFVRERIRTLDRYGLGLVHSGKARFWQYDRLARQPIVNDELDNLKLLVVYDPVGKSSAAWNRVLDGRELTFQRANDNVIDNQTQSTWDIARGIATEGELVGKELTAVAAIMSFTDAWSRFHPSTSQWQP